jgi:hypothetical protein
MNAVSGSARRPGSEGEDSAQQADERALEHERPADERIRRADQAHDLDLLGAGEDREADRVDDDEQHDQADDDQTTVPAVRRMPVTVSTGRRGPPR